MSQTDILDMHQTLQSPAHSENDPLQEISVCGRSQCLLAPWELLRIPVCARAFRLQSDGDIHSIGDLDDWTRIVFDSISFSEASAYTLNAIFNVGVKLLDILPTALGDTIKNRSSTHISSLVADMLLFTEVDRLGSNGTIERMSLFDFGENQIYIHLAIRPKSDLENVIDTETDFDNGIQCILKSTFHFSQLRKLIKQNSVPRFRPKVKALDKKPLLNEAHGWPGYDLRDATFEWDKEESIIFSNNPNFIPSFFYQTWVCKEQVMEVGNN